MKLTAASIIALFAYVQYASAAAQLCCVNIPGGCDGIVTGKEAANLLVKDSLAPLACCRFARGTDCSRCVGCRLFKHSIAGGLTDV